MSTIGDIIGGVASIIPGVGGYLGSVANANAQKDINAQNIAWQKQALDINEANTLTNWNLQNEYNTPAAQMKRFQDAGLNPNLIYSQGNPGNAASISTPQLGTPDLKAPDVGGKFKAIGDAVPQALSMYQDYKLKSAQYDNTTANTTVANANRQNIDADTANKIAQNPGITADSKSKAIGTLLNQSLFDTNVEQGKENLRSTQISNTYQPQLLSNQSDLQRQQLSLNVANYDLNAAKTDMSLKQGMQAIIESKARSAYTLQQTTNLHMAENTIQNDQELQSLDIGLKKAGLTWSDPLYQRAAQAYMNGTQSAATMSKTLLGEGVSGLTKLLRFFK